MNASSHVVIIGAGPAGLAAAIEVQSAGASAILLERTARPVRLAETLYGLGTQLLHGLGITLAKKPPAVRLVSQDGSRSLRLEMQGGPSVQAGFSTQAEPDAHAMPGMIDRVALEMELRARVQEAGAEIWLGAEAIALERDPEGFSILTRDSTARHQPRLQASVVIDATGKMPLTAGGLRHAEPVGEKLDARQSAFTHYRRDRGFDIDETMLVAAPEGFFYVVPAAADRICVGRVQYGAAPLDEAAFLRGLEASPAFASLLDGASRVLPFITARNQETRVACASSDGLFAAGDALGFRDPFLWDGIGHALQTGASAGALCAGIVLGTITAPEAASRHAAAVHGIEQQVRQTALQALALEGSFPPSLLLDPHMAPPVLATLLTLAGGGSIAAELAARRSNPSLLQASGADQSRAVAA